MQSKQNGTFKSGLRNTVLAAAVGGLFMFGSGRVNAEDKKPAWPQFHGPDRNNISAETGLLKEWPATGPAVAWQIKGLGGGYSSVAIANGKIYTAGDAADACYMLAMTETDGKPLWKAKIGKTGGQYSGPRATPTIDGANVYMMGQWGDLVCCNAETGAEIWRTNLNSDLGGKMMSGWGNAESVLIDGDKVICTPGGSKGTLAGLDKLTGKVIWRSAEITDPSAYTAPVIAEIGKVRQAVILTDKSVAGISVADGSLLWKAGRQGKTAVIPTPVVLDNMVYVTSGYGIGCNMFEVSVDGASFSAKQKYDNKTMVNHHGGVIYLDKYIYGYSDGGGWTCQELTSGEAKWQDRKLLGKGTITYADGRFYLRDEGSGQVLLLEAGPENHAVKGKLEQPDRSKAKAWPHLVVANGKLYVRDQDILLCYDVKAK